MNPPLQTSTFDLGIDHLAEVRDFVTVDDALDRTLHTVDIPAQRAPLGPTTLVGWADAMELPGL